MSYHECKVCGRTYAREEWFDLKRKANGCRPSGDGPFVQDFRDCVCGNTLMHETEIRVRVDEEGPDWFSLALYDHHDPVMVLGNIQVLRYPGKPPAVTNIGVADDWQRCKLGTGLYEFAAQYCCNKWGEALRSDQMRSPNAQGFWEKQERKGRASFDPNDGPRGRYALKCPAGSLSGAPVTPLEAAARAQEMFEARSKKGRGHPRHCSLQERTYWMLALNEVPRICTKSYPDEGARWHEYEGEGQCPNCGWTPPRD